MADQRLRQSPDIAQSLAQDRLGVASVVFFVMSAAAPFTVVAGLITTAYAVTGLVGIPAAFIAVGLILASFSIGYVAMSRYLPHAGAFYAYVAHGLGKPFGVGTAWVALVAYNCLQVALYGGFGVATSGTIAQFTGVELAWWVYAVAAWALVAALGLLRVDLNGSVLAVLLIAEIVIIAIYDFAFITKPAEGLDLALFSPAELMQSGAGALLAIAVLGFVGFESAVVFSEESRDPRRTIPAATFSSIALIALLYGISSWAMAVAAGSGNIVDLTREQEIGTIFGLAAERLGPFFADLGSVLLLTSLIAAMISFHNTIARYIFALGREGVLPRSFGTTSASGAPRNGSVAQSVLALVIIAIYAAFGLDPLVQLFYTLGTTGGFGVLILITATAYAVLVFFRRNDTPEPSWRVTVMPLVAVVLVTVMFLTAVYNFDTMLGVPPNDPLRWGLPGLLLLVAALGTLYGYRLKQSNPKVYAAIGMGAKSSTVTLPGAVSESVSRSR